jgi:hypothetical protein
MHGVLQASGIILMIPFIVKVRTNNLHHNGGTVIHKKCGKLIF